MFELQKLKKGYKNAQIEDSNGIEIVSVNKKHLDWFFKRIEALETANDLLHMENKEYQKALKEIAKSEEDSSCNELALKYEVIAEKALNG